ncbi:TonB-dependent receptor (plasmid) [Novosphingobium sp. BL-8A]|uniref:TonB-dependent receptor n=1 Tax=Novosphingobium sp. BL-8A TaxID=3127639 RepID=UPI00375670A1
MATIMAAPSAHAAEAIADQAQSASSQPAATPANSDTIPEIIVTAERKQESAQRTALAVSVLSGADIAKTGIQTADKLLQQVPSVQVQPSVSPTTGLNVAIRGLGTDGDNKPGATSIYLDGVLTTTMGAELYDISRVEVLRGPQGTLYGGIATGGAVNIITNNPSFDRDSGSVSIEAGNYGLVHATGVINTPASDTLALRAAVNFTRRNTFSDSDTTFLSEVNARLKLFYKPNADLSILLAGELYRGNGVGYDGSKEVNAQGKVVGPWYPASGDSNRDAYRLWSDISYDFGFASLTNIASIERYNKYSEVLTASSPSVDGYGALKSVTPKRDTITEELRLSSAASSPVSWVAGFWYKNYHLADTADIGIPPGSLPVTEAATLLQIPEEQKTNQYGLFGQVKIPLFDRAHLTLGARQSWDDIRYNQYYTYMQPFLSCGAETPGGPPVFGPCTVPTLYEGSFKNFDYLVRFDYEITPQNMVYALTSTGYRPGGGSAPRTEYLASAPVYDKEKITSYEIGTKNRFLGGKLQINGDIFYYDYPNFQNQFVSYGGPGNVIQLRSIVGVPARFFGAELETVTQFSHADRLTFSVNYLNAKYTKDSVYTDPFNPTGPQLAIDTNGGVVPHAPKFSVNASYSHTFDLGSAGTLDFAGTIHYQTKQAILFDPCLYTASLCQAGVTAQTLTQKAYEVTDLSATYTLPSGRVHFTAYGRNVFDEKIKTDRFGSVFNLAAPAQYGFIVAADF